MRYPLLWEQLAPDSLGQINWRWADERLAKLRELGIRPIVGLLHHGSGPKYTSLLDAEFPAKLARFARAVAERYPWLDAFIPVNEPLTTARFSGLYGHWYPHTRDELTFVRCLLTQLRGVVLAMRAIREVTPGAELVQTEDLGKTFATPLLQYQADFENERRWITWDLLCGAVAPDHRMWQHFRWLGIPAAEINWFRENASPPDVVGVNYYVTSERYLDDKISAHPLESHGGNDRHRYVDVAAVRVRSQGLSGIHRLLRETCERYDLPVAVTEAHLGCSRPEQLRWLEEMVRAAQRLRNEGGDVRAVTAWSLFGAHDWSTLLTRQDGGYEPGAFDVRAEKPRQTAIGRMISSFSGGRRFDHPALSARGWWHRPIRFGLRVQETDCFATRDTRRLLIVGHNAVAQGFLFGTQEAGLAAVVADDLEQTADPDEIWAVIDCRFAPASKFGAACAGAGIQYARIVPAPAISLVESELSICVGEIFGTGTEEDLVANAIRTLAAGERFAAACDAPIAATYLPDLVVAVIDLLVDGATGIWRLSNPQPTTPAELAQLAARFADVDARLIDPVPGWSIGRAAELEATGATEPLLPPLESAVRHYADVVLASLPSVRQTSA